MEQFLAELLTDALLTFDESYQKCYNDHILQLERLLEDALGVRLAPPLIISVPKVKP